MHAFLMFHVSLLRAKYSLRKLLVNFFIQFMISNSEVVRVFCRTTIFHGTSAFPFPKPGELQRDATSSKVEPELRYQSQAFYQFLEHADHGIPV